MLFSPKRRLYLLLPLFCGLTFWSAQAAADYPEKAVRLVVPFPPGGSFDGPARLLATRLSTLSGKPFVVETRAGAGGALGAAEVSRAAPDGYTVLLSNGAMPVSAALSKKPLFEAVEGFSHIATFGVLPFAVVVNGKAPFDNLQDLIAASKAAPGKYNYASAGTGSASHLSAELVKEAFGLDWVHVPYRGSGPAMNDLMAGQVTMSVPRAQLNSHPSQSWRAESAGGDWGHALTAATPCAHLGRNQTRACFRNLGRYLSAA